MKKLLFIILLLGSMKAFSQETIPANVENKSPSDTVYEEADKLPEYPGGVNAFRKNFTQTFDSSKIKGKGIMKSEALFVISKEGLITEVTAIGENKSMNTEMERSIKAASKTRWKPAELKGQPVKYRFRLPITMSFD